MKEKNETFESALKKLEGMVDKLEDGSITLDEALNTFESGIHWSRECNKFLNNAEKNNAILLTTEKDYFRINKNYKKKINYLRILVEIENRKQFIDEIKKAVFMENNINVGGNVSTSA